MAALNESELVEANPAQVLEGTPVTAPGASSCTACGRDFHSTDEVTVYAYRLGNGTEFDVARIYCRDGCSPGTLVGTLGATDVLANARLGDLAHPSSRSYRRCLTEVAVCAVSGRNSGGSP